MDIKIIAVIKALLLPPAGLLLLGLLGLFFRPQRLADALITVSLLGLIVCSLPVFVTLWANSWETVPPLPERSISQSNPEAIVVLGGGLKQSGSKVVLKTGTLLRLRYAANLARHTGLPLLVSGGGRLEKFDFSEAELMADCLRNDYGVHARWLEDESRNTAENAFNSSKMLREQGIRRVMLVTQAYHMPRALVQFEKQGLMVLPAPTDFIASDEEWDVFSFIPSAEALNNSFLLAHEWFGLYWYKLRY